MAEKKIVLLVDDDSDFVKSNRLLLEAVGYEVHTANTGAQGVETAKSVHPDLILLDVMMDSQYEGFQVNEKIRETPELKDTPVIMLSGINDQLDSPYRFDVEKGWPCVAFLEKPIPPETLLTNVKNFIT